MFIPMKYVAVKSKATPTVHHTVAKDYSKTKHPKFVAEIIGANISVAIDSQLLSYRAQKSNF